VTVVINEMDVEPVERSEAQSRPATPGTPERSTAELEALVERVTAARASRHRRLRAY
jgi:hypothetical protein